MIKEIMIPYLGWLRASLDDRNGTRRIDDILIGIYPPHITEAVRLQARRLQFTGHFIPSGLADKHHRLDRSIFAASSPHPEQSA
jgi:hypothetical protein